MNKKFSIVFTNEELKSNIVVNNVCSILKQLENKNILYMIPIEIFKLDLLRRGGLIIMDYSRHEKIHIAYPVVRQELSKYISSGYKEITVNDFLKEFSNK